MAQPKTSVLLEELEFQAQKYSLFARFSAAQADIILQGPSSTNLSAGMAGENILLGTRSGTGSFYVFWLNYRNSVISLACFDQRRNRSWLLPFSGFSFIGCPEVIENKGTLRALIFLGNRSDNDDIFYYEPETDLLLPLTQTRFSEKEFSLQDKGGRLEIETRSLRKQYRYRFDRQQQKSTLLEEHYLLMRSKQDSVITAGYQNTYIGFGDSITWGLMEGKQRLDLCYLTQLRTILNDPWDFINLGIPGQSTYDGAQRVDHELAENQALYFLLMMGVNDVWRNTFSLDSSLENLEYMVDSALARGRQVVISTLTPRHDRFSHYKFYWDHLYALSSGILDLAKAKNIASIDPLTAFMNTNPPDGWKELLERIIPNVSSGNHPNGEGHRIIANLFAAWVGNEPPLPVITVDNAEILWHEPVSFSAKNSTDPDGSIVGYAWDFGNGDSRTGMDVTYTFPSFGAIPVKLTVTDNKGASASASKIMAVKPLNPVIKTDKDEIYWQETILFNASGSLCADGSIVKYTWNFADEEFGEGIHVSHKFANNKAYGDLPVKLTVTNDKNVSASATRIIKVKPRPFPVITTDRDEIFWQDIVTFDGNKSLILPGFTVKYIWDFADGEVGQGIQASHKFANAGAYGDKVVKLTITDNKNVSAMANKIIKVKAPYSAHTTYEKRKIRTIIYNRWGYFVAWTKNAKNAVSGYNIVKYRIFRKAVSAAGDYTPIAEVDAAIYKYLDISIDQATDYEYVACAVDAQGHVSPVHNF